MSSNRDGSPTPRDAIGHALRRHCPAIRRPRNGPPAQARRLRPSQVASDRAPASIPGVGSVAFLVRLRPRPKELLCEVIDADLGDTGPADLIDEPAAGGREVVGTRRGRGEASWISAEAPRPAVDPAAAGLAGASSGGGRFVALAYRGAPRGRPEGRRRHRRWKPSRNGWLRTPKRGISGRRWYAESERRRTTAAAERPKILDFTSNFFISTIIFTFWRRKLSMESQECHRLIHTLSCRPAQIRD